MPPDAPRRGDFGGGLGIFIARRRGFLIDFFSGVKIHRRSICSQLDLNMEYYIIRLDPDSSKICTIILPWGKYFYQRLPMGVAGSSPDIFQEKMSVLVVTLEYARAYIYHFLVISEDSVEDHLAKLKVLLK